MKVNGIHIDFQHPVNFDSRFQRLFNTLAGQVTAAQGEIPEAGHMKMTYTTPESGGKAGVVDLELEEPDEPRGS